MQRADSQTQNELTARTLYYNSGSDVEAKPAVAKQPKRAPVRTSATANAGGTSSAMATTPPETPVPASVSHLGVRYNVLLIDSSSGSEQPVDPSRLFHDSDCLALSVQSNYDGYLYVLDRGSSGKWDVLLPSMDMADESNFVKARTTVKAPAQYCFSLSNPPGVEHLYLVLARSPQDISQLNSAVKASRGGSAAAETSSGSDSQTAKPPSIETQMARLEQGMRSRDLRITKVSKPGAAGEPANAVYVVDTSPGASDRIITEIQITHN
jgi:hypothetical protein